MWPWCREEQESAMNNAQREMLIGKVLGECWHEVRGDAYPDDQDYSKCIHCGIECTVEWSRCISGKIPMNTVPDHDVLVATNNRTFTTDWNDLRDLKNKLVERGMWDKFYYYGFAAYAISHSQSVTQQGYVDWLFQMPRFVELVAEWWEKEGRGDETSNCNGLG
jgi:hypothetical protein